MHAEGMVTRNDVIRNELLLSNLQLAVNVIDNNINILNKQLTTALSLPDELLILPDTTLLASRPHAEDLRYYQSSPSVISPISGWRPRIPRSRKRD